jgi:hypothetical protein
MRVQISQSCDQSPNVLRIARMHKVKVKRGNRRPLQNCSDTSDYYVADLIGSRASERSRESQVLALSPCILRIDPILCCRTCNRSAGVIESIHLMRVTSTPSAP